MEKICNVPHGSTIRFEHGGRMLEGVNRQTLEDDFEVYVFTSGPHKTLVLPPDTEVEIIRTGGIKGGFVG